jgi:hypothetical protein
MFYVVGTRDVDGGAAAAATASAVAIAAAVAFFFENIEKLHEFGTISMFTNETP